MGTRVPTPFDRRATFSPQSPHRRRVFFFSIKYACGMEAVHTKRQNVFAETHTICIHFTLILSVSSHCVPVWVWEWVRFVCPRRLIVEHCFKLRGIEDYIQNALLYRIIPVAYRRNTGRLLRTRIYVLMQFTLYARIVRIPVRADRMYDTCVTRWKSLGKLNWNASVWGSRAAN